MSSVHIQCLDIAQGGFGAKYIFFLKITILVLQSGNKKHFPKNGYDARYIKQCLC